MLELGVRRDELGVFVGRTEMQEPPMEVAIPWGVPLSCLWVSHTHLGHYQCTTVRLKNQEQFICFFRAFLLCCMCCDSFQQKGVSILDYILTFLVSVLASVVSYYICKWLDGDK